MSNLISKEPIPWQPLPHMEEYLRELVAQLRAEDYIRKIKGSLGYFSQYVRDEGVRHPDELKRSHIIGFQSWVNDQVASRSWRQSYGKQQMVHVRGWLNWLEDIEYIEENPWRRIKLKGYSKSPKPISEDELALLFETHRKQAFAMPPFFWHRREVIITLLYGWGLRIHELVALTATQMDMRQDFVTMRQKGGRSKNLPYTEPIKDVVQRYLRARTQYARPGEDAVLIDQQGRAIGIETVRKAVTDLGKAAGVDVNPHRLRDTFGTDAINSDMAVERISKIMGHSNVKQTLAYSDINNRSLYESHDQAMSPRLNKLLGRPQR